MLLDSQNKNTAWHALSAEQLSERLHWRQQGLTVEEVAQRLAAVGPNILREAKQPGPFSLFLKQLANPLVFLLLGAAAISLVARHVIDAIVIGVVVLLNSVIGTVQEWRAEKALEALRLMSPLKGRVVRDGELRTIDIANIVPGDVLMLETGDRVPADVRLVEATELTVDESALTGESEPVRKAVAVIGEEVPLGDRLNMVWRSTMVSGGRGLGLVVDTGMRTIIGQIAAQVMDTERSATPLQERLEKLGKYIGLAAVGAGILLLGFGLLRGFELVELLLFAVAATVSAIPEGLPAVVTVVLAAGVQRMSKRNALVRRLSAVETLGSTTVVCSDKTGTITRNQMTVSRIWTADGAYSVEGEGFKPDGRVLADDGDAVDLATASRPDLKLLIEIGALANNALLQNEHGRWVVHGNPTDGALLVLARKLRVYAEELEPSYRRFAEISFSSARKYMATLNRWGDESRLFVKGAPERLLAASTHLQVGDVIHVLTEEQRHTIQAANSRLAAESLRVVAGAYRPMTATKEGVHHDEAESQLVFVGMWGLLDPPREEVIAAITSAQQAGIRVVMITGDHATTASAIAQRVGIIGHGEQTVSGEEINLMSDEELRSRVEHIAVYARVEPNHKLRIVEALKAQGETVAMTGDGVNDAPALKAANIGIAMGLAGTEVAKEAADMVLADDNFATIIDAIEEGRVIFSNLRRVVAFLMTTASAEVMVFFAAMAFGFHLPLTAVMILWVNLVADGITAIPLGMEAQHTGVLEQPPRSSREGVLSRVTVSRLAFLAAIAAIGVLSLFAWELKTKDLAHAQTIAFTTLVAFQWFKSVTWRTSIESLFSTGIFGNRGLMLALGVAVLLQLAAIYTPLGRLAFGTVPLASGEWVRIIVVSSSVLIADEILKLVRRRIRAKRAVSRETSKGETTTR